ncbi:MAG: hypothetical protein OEX19_15205 [Gammaproteobacteria bacterium]|nr:hypothetical protein [Gammaproteobacteria bacterium]
MNTIRTIVGIVLLTMLKSGYPEDLKDPRTRDEDLSKTVITVQTNILSNGYYEYLYDIQTVDNLGLLSAFSIDVSCAYDFGSTSYMEEPDRYFTGNYSKDGLHIPLQAYSVSGFTARLTISEYNQLGWMVYMKPGKIAKGFRIVSPAQPGLRKYELTPVMDPDGWDYNSYDENDPTVPWIDDFTVTGMITGPACPGDIGSFPGTNKHNKESEEINNLLTYSAPLTDRFHVDKDKKEVEFSIHYADNIDPETFKVEPRRFESLFTPVPGATQTVKLLLDKRHWRTRVKFEVREINKDKNKRGPSFGGQGFDEGRSKNKHSSGTLGLESMKDTDIFEIRTEKYDKNKHGSRYKHWDDKDHKNVDRHVSDQKHRHTD